VRHQHRVHAAEEAHRERQAAAQGLEAVLERRDAATHLARVFHRHAGLLVDLVEQQVGEGRLRAFDLRREHRLLANEAVAQQRSVGQVDRERVEPAQGEQRVVEAAPQRRRPADRWLRRQGCRHERAKPLARDGDLDIRAGRASAHEAAPSNKKDRCFRLMGEVKSIGRVV
jgi:hypothetical protein